MNEKIARNDLKPTQRLIQYFPLRHFAFTPLKYRYAG